MIKNKKKMVKLFLLVLLMFISFDYVLAQSYPNDCGYGTCWAGDVSAAVGVGAITKSESCTEASGIDFIENVLYEGINRIDVDNCPQNIGLTGSGYCKCENLICSKSGGGVCGSSSDDETVEGMCVPWQVSVEGSSEICGQCGDNGDCGEYECRSLGQKCRWFSENCLYCLEGDEDRDGVCDEIDNDISTGIPITPDQTRVEPVVSIVFIDPDITRGAAGIVKRIQNDQNNFVVNIRVDGRGTESCEYNSGSGFRSMIPKSQLEVSPLFFMTETIQFTLDYMNVRFRCGDRTETLNVIRNQVLQINFPQFFDSIDNDNIVSEDDVAHEFIVSSTANELIRCEYSLGDGVAREFPNDCSGNPNCLWVREHRANLGEFFERDGTYNIQISCKNFKEVPEVDTATYVVNVNANLLRFSSLDDSVRGNALERRIIGAVNGGEGQNIECRYWKMDGVRSEDGARRAVSNVRYESSWLLADSSEISNIQKTGDKTYSISQDLPRLNGEDTYYGIICRDSSNHNIQVSGFVSIIDYVTSLTMTISDYVPSQAFSDVVITTSGGLNNNGLARCWYKNTEADSFENVNWDDAVLIGENQNSFSFRLPQTGYFERESNPYYFKCEDVNLANNFDWKRKNYDIAPSDDNRLEIVEVVCEDCNSNGEGGLRQEWVLRTEKGVRNGDATCQYTCPWTEGPANFDRVEYLAGDGVKLHKKTFEIDGETIINNKAYSCTFECSNGVEEAILPKSMSFKTPALRVVDFGLFSDANGENKIQDDGTIGFEDAYLIVKTKGGLDGNGNAECRVTNGLLDSLIIVEGGRERHNFFNDAMRDVLRSNFGGAGWILNTMTQIGRTFVSEEEAKIHSYKLPKEILQEASNGDAKNYNYWIQCRDVDFRGRYAVRPDGKEKLSNLVRFNVDFRDLIINFVKPAAEEISEGSDVELEFNVRGGTTFGNLLTEGRVSSCRVDNLLTGEDGVLVLRGDDRNVARMASTSAPNTNLGRRERMTVFNTVLNNLEPGEHVYRVVCSDLNSKSVGSSEILFETEIKDYNVVDNWDQEDTIVDNFEWSIVATGGNKGYGGGECTYSIDGTTVDGRFIPNNRDQTITPFNANIDVSRLDGVYTFRAGCSDDGFDSDHTDDEIFVHRGILVERGVEAGGGQCDVGVIFAGNVNCLCRSTKVTSSDFGKYCCESGNVVNSVDNCPAVCAAEDCKPLSCSNYENFESCRNITQGAVECSGIGSCCIGSCSTIRISPLQINGLNVGPKNAQNEIGTNKPEIKFRLAGGRGGAICYYGGEFGDVNESHLFNKRAISATEWEYTKQFYEELANRNYGEGEYVVWCDETGVVGDSEEVPAFRVNVIKTCSEAGGATYTQQCSVLKKDSETCDVVGGSVGSNEYCCETECIAPSSCDVGVSVSSDGCLCGSEFSKDTSEYCCQIGANLGIMNQCPVIQPVVVTLVSPTTTQTSSPVELMIRTDKAAQCTYVKGNQNRFGDFVAGTESPVSMERNSAKITHLTDLSFTESGRYHYLVECVAEDGGRGNKLASFDLNLGGTPRGDLSLTLASLSPITRIPALFNLEVRTTSPLDLGQCKYTIKEGRYTDYDSLPAFSSMRNFNNVARDKLSQIANINLGNIFSPIEVENGDYGIYVRCEREGRYGEAFSYVNVNIPLIVGECNTIDQCTISGVRWYDLNNQEIPNAFEGDNVKLRAEFDNCECLDVRFNIRENDGVGRKQDVGITALNGKVSNDIAEAGWVVGYHPDDFGLDSNPEYVFKANILNSNKESSWSNELSVERPLIIFTDDSIRNNENIIPDNDTWKIEANIVKNRRNVDIEFTYNTRNYFFSMDNLGNRKYSVNKDGFLEALIRSGMLVSELPLGAYTYIIAAYDDDARTGEITLPRTFNIVEGLTVTETCTDGQIRTTNCSPINGCNTQEVCVNNIWSNSCVDVPNDNCPTDSGGSAFVISKVEPISDVVKGPAFRLIISEDAPQEVQCRYANNLWNELESRYEDRFVPYPTFDSLTGLFSKARDAVHIHGADIPTNTLNLGDHRVFVACKAGALEQFALINFRVVEASPPSCTENWQCTDWTPVTCPASGQQTKTCTDLNSCDTTTSKPEETRGCTPGTTPPQGGNPITITVQNPTLTQEFTSSPVTFTLNIGTSEALSLNQCRYAFKRGRYISGNLPAFGGMTNFENIGSDGRSQNSQILFSNYDIYSRFGDGEYGYYIRCENGANIGDRLGHIVVAVNAPPPREVEPIILSVEENEGSPGRIECPANHIVSSANARYYCPNNPSNLIVCNVEKYIGRNYASALFDHQTEGSECRGDDPCPGVAKRGNLTIGCVPTGYVLPKTECEDGIDNDKNGCADFGIDPECTGTDDINEEGGICPSGLTQCSDGIDNDGDGCVDLDNEGDCNTLTDNTEVGSVCSLCVNTGNEICDDGRDNNCNHQLDCNEASCSTSSACQTIPPGGGGGAPVAANECTVSSIRWVNLETEATISNIEEGTVVNALIEGEDCNIGDTVNYEIKEKEGGALLDLLLPDEGILSPRAVTFSAEGVTLIQWTATRQEDTRNPNNAYYMKIGSTNSGNLNVIPRTGPVTCTPSVEICTDGRDNDCDNNIDCYDNDCGGNAACTGQITPLIIRNMGPSSSTDFSFELFITLGGGSGGNGNAECYWDEVPNPQMNLDTLIPGAFANRFSNFRNEFSGGVFNTRYYTNVIKPNGEHTFYLRCRDPNGANISLQQMTTRVNVPDANRLRILNAGPNGTTYGIRNVDVNANTAGGRGNGANVRCSYSGGGLTGNLNPVLSSGNIYTHNANLQNVPVGNNAFTITCTDDAETVTSNINFNVALDTTAPQIVQIVTSGTKYIRTNEESLCRLSTTSNVDAGADLSRDESRKIHSVITSSSYYVRCRDNWGNVGNIVKVNV